MMRSKFSLQTSVLNLHIDPIDSLQDGIEVVIDTFPEDFR